VRGRIETSSFTVAGLVVQPGRDDAETSTSERSEEEVVRWLEPQFGIT
jgi:hypothetical protein